jgi:hypothetical protein
MVRGNRAVGADVGDSLVLIYVYEKRSSYDDCEDDRSNMAWVV